MKYRVVQERDNIFQIQVKECILCSWEDVKQGYEIGAPLTFFTDRQAAITECDRLQKIANERQFRVIHKSYLP